MSKYLDDVLYICGAGLIVYATYLINQVAALYVTGIVFVISGVLVGIGGKRQP